jgi:hypothetical protein
MCFWLVIFRIIEVSLPRLERKERSQKTSYSYDKDFLLTRIIL